MCREKVARATPGGTWWPQRATAGPGSHPGEPDPSHGEPGANTPLPPREGPGRADAPKSAWSSSGMFTGKSRSSRQLFLRVLNFTEHSRAPA